MVVCSAYLQEFHRNDTQSLAFLDLVVLPATYCIAMNVLGLHLVGAYMYALCASGAVNRRVFLGAVCEILVIHSLCRETNVSLDRT